MPVDPVGGNVDGGGNEIRIVGSDSGTSGSLKRSSKLRISSSTVGTIGSSKSGVSPWAQPQVMLSSSLDNPQVVPGTSPPVPHTMLSHSGSAVVSHCVPHTMFSHSSSSGSHCV